MATKKPQPKSKPKSKSKSAQPNSNKLVAMQEDIAKAINQLVQAITSSGANAVAIIEAVQQTVSSALLNAHGSGDNDPKP